jgi:hypothetical protein
VRRRRIALLVAVTAAVLFGAVGARGAVAPAPGLVYAGDNAQRNLVVLQLNAKRTQVRQLTWLFSAPCVAGPAATPPVQTSVLITGEAFAIPINRSGVWSKRFRASRVGENGNTFATAYTVNGRRRGANMTGTLRSVATEVTPSGGLVKTCDTRPIAFTIADRNVFGGLTTGQSNPIAVTMNPARTRVTRLRWDWQGPCALGSAKRADTETDVYYTDFVSDLAVDKLGRFGGQISFPPQPDSATGITTSYSYRITARRVGLTIKGTITASIIEVDTATGGEIRRCSSGPVRFSARD